MGSVTSIEWTDATWPIVQGCDPVSQGCVHCYAVKLLWRMMHNPDPKISGPLQGLVEKHINAAGEKIYRFTGKVALREDRLTWPLKWKTPRMIFVPSHGDLFHKDVPDSFIDKVFAVMALAPQHTFQVLTKRSARMRDWFAQVDIGGSDGTERSAFGGSPQSSARTRVIVTAAGMLHDRPDLKPAARLAWPLPNVWLGVSAEDQANADARIPHLLATPAAVRFVSLEPLLGPIHLGYLGWPNGRGEARNGYNALLGARYDGGEIVELLPKLDWIIVGGESGKGARPMHPDWARSLRDQCAAAGLPFFFKQWGEWVSVSEVEGEGPHFSFPDGATVRRIGKKAAGRTLDRREHSEFPRVPSLKPKEKPDAADHRHSA